MENHKKIKLVTFAPNSNFGTCLQSYALNHILKQMGHKVEFIYNGRETPPIHLCVRIIRYIISFFPVSVKNLIIEIFFRNNNHVKDPYILALPNNPIFGIMFKIGIFRKLYNKLKYRTPRDKKVFKFTFLDGNYNMVRLCTKKDYISIIKNTDVFITASDQIWNPFCGGFNPFMFLEFAGDVKRIAYSSSISHPCFPSTVEERARIDLSKFKHIAVREKSSVLYLNKLLKRNDVKLVVDPTCLLSKNSWISFSERADIDFDLPNDYILCYFVGSRTNDYSKMVDRVKGKTGIKNVITINCYDNKNFEGAGFVYNNGGPYEFVYLLRHAKFVCMDSFHATIFALKFGIEFTHILKHADNSDVYSQNTRMYDLLNRYGIMYKIYDENSDAWLRPIDFEKVNHIMNTEISDSIDYLKTALLT